MVEKLGLKDDVEELALKDGKRYFMPQLFDQPFYDGGLIMRQDYLEEKGFDAPKTFDDLYEILKAYKAEHPDSYPLRRRRMVHQDGNGRRNGYLRLLRPDRRR